MTGIGCIIIIMQLPPLLGHNAPEGDILNILLALPVLCTHIQADALAAGLLTLMIVLFTPVRISRVIPSQLIALLIGTLAVLFVLTDASVLGTIPIGLPEFQTPTFSLPLLKNMLFSALVLALLGSIDSLLTSLVADNMTQSYHDPDKELVGQGIGNIIAGLFGALPGAGATMRTVVNIRTGGRTKRSGMLHALILLTLVLGLAPLASHIPHAVLAGMLIKVGIEIIDWGYLRLMPRAPRSGVFFMLIVWGLTVFVNLIIAVATGVVLASLLLVKRMADLQLASIHAINGETSDISLSAKEKRILRRNEGRVVLVVMSGAMSFGAARDMARKLGETNHYDVLVVDMSDVTMIDSTTAIAIEDLINQVQSRHKHVLLVGLQPKVSDVLNRLDGLKYLASGHCHDDRLEALHHAAHIAGSIHPDDIPPSQKAT